VATDSLSGKEIGHGDKGIPYKSEGGEKKQKTQMGRKKDFCSTKKGQECLMGKISRKGEIPNQIGGG